MTMNKKQDKNKTPAQQPPHAEVSYEITGLRGGETCRKKNVGAVTTIIDNKYRISCNAFKQKDDERVRAEQTYVVITDENNSIAFQGYITTLIALVKPPMSAIEDS